MVAEIKPTPKRGPPPIPGTQGRTKPPALPTHTGEVRPKVPEGTRSMPELDAHLKSVLTRAKLPPGFSATGTKHVEFSYTNPAHIAPAVDLIKKALGPETKTHEITTNVRGTNYVVKITRK